jgi:hypothetical protein
LTEPFSTVSVNSEGITSSHIFVGVSTTNPSQPPSLAVERTTKIPSVSVTSTTSSSSSDSVIKQDENSQPTATIPPSESSNHSNLAAAQEFLQVVTAAKNVSSTTEKIQFSRPMHRPSTATLIKFSPSIPNSATSAVHTQPQTTNQNSVQSWKPAKPPQITLTTRNITKTTTKPHIVSSPVQTSTANPVATTNVSLPVTTDKNKEIPTADLQKTDLLNIKSTILTTTELPPQTTTSINDSENLFINEDSGPVPMEIGSPVGVISLPVTAIGNLDMPPELAESVLGVLSQVAGVEGAVTTIDYGGDSLYSLSTTTEHSISDHISSTHSSSVTTANENGLQSSTKILNHENIVTGTNNTVHNAPPTETPPTTNLHVETNKQNAVTTQPFRKATPSHELNNFYLKESTDYDSNTQYLSLENTSNIYEQETVGSATVHTGIKHEKNDPVDVNKTEMQTGGKGDYKIAEEPNKLVEELVNIEAQMKVNNETTKEEAVGSTSVEFLSNAVNSNGALKTSLGILKTEPYFEETATSKLEETASHGTYNVIVTTEVTDDVTTGNDGTEPKESTVTSLSELTTEQLNSDRNTITNVVNEASSGELDTEETSAATKSEERYVTEISITPESEISRDTTESAIQTTKGSLETSTVTLTKYKKNDGETTEASVQSNITSKLNNKPEAVKISSDNISSATQNASDGDMQSTASESQESTTNSEPAAPDNEMQNEDLNMPTSATTNNEFILTKETGIVDKTHENIHSGETKIDTNLAGDSDLTTYLPAQDKSEEETSTVTVSSETTAGSFTTEITSNYEMEVTTLDIRFTTDNEDKPSFRDDESKDTTDASVVESKIENEFTKTSLKAESEMNVKDVNQWEPKVTSSTGLLEKETEPNITKTTSGTTSWTKLSTLSPSQANNSKVIDKTPSSSTRRPVNGINTVSTTEEAGNLKVSGLNQEKVKDTKNEAQPEKPQRPQAYTTVDLEPAPHENLGLEATSAALEDDVRRFAELCNELAFRLWASITAKGLTMSRSVIMSPFAVTALLAMVFLGARGPTSGQMNDILRLDDMVTFNPHQVFKNVTDSLVLSRTQGIATAAIVRELYSDKVSKVEVCNHFIFSVLSQLSQIGPMPSSNSKLKVKNKTVVSC